MCSARKATGVKFRRGYPLYWIPPEGRLRAFFHGRRSRYEWFGQAFVDGIKKGMESVSDPENEDEENTLGDQWNPETEEWE